MSAEDAERLRKHKDRAVELTVKGKLDAAVVEYQAALEVAPADVFTRHRVAELLARLGRTAEAVEHYVCLVGKYASEGHLLKAIATCHLVLQLEPTHGKTMVTLSDLYAERDAPRAPVRMPSGMCGAMVRRPSTPPTMIDPATLARIPLFSDLAPSAFGALLREFKLREMRMGEMIVEEGTPGDALFAIAHGTLRVERRAPPSSQRVIAEMKEGEFFGEMSLVSRCPRFATVTAKSDGTLLELGRDALERIVAAHPRVGEVVDKFYKERLLANVLRASAVFRALPDDRQATLSDLVRLDAEPPKKLLLEQGQPSAGFFLLLRGECEVFHRGKDGKEHAYPPMREGDVFGEVSLLQGGPVTASVRTATPCVVLTLQREWFDELLLGHPPVRAHLYDLASKRLERTREILTKELLDERLV